MLANKAEFEGFTVAIEDGLAAQNIQFDWLLVNTKQLSQTNAASQQ